MRLTIKTFAICIISLFLLTNCYTSSNAIGQESDNKRSQNNINKETEQVEGVKNNPNIENKMKKISEFRKSLIIPE